MGQRITVEHFDDTNPDETATTTVRFAHDGSRYEIDLSTENARELAAVLAPYIAAARKAGTAPANGAVGAGASPRRAQASSGARRASGGSSGRPPGLLSEYQRVRREWRERVYDWADATGHPEPGHRTNGRMPDGLVSAYVAANPDDPEAPNPRSLAEAQALGPLS